jgi:threonine dehydratase
VLAAAYQSRAMLAGSNVACVMTGGNIDAATLRTIMCPAGGAPS